MNILHELKDKYGKAIVKGLVNQQNISDKQANAALNIALPTLMASVIRKVGTERGVNYLQDLIDQEGYDGSLLNRLEEPNVKTALKKEIDQGEKMLPVLLGSSIIKENVLNISSKLTNLPYQSTKSTYSFLTPVILNFLGKKVREKNLNKNNLVKLLKEQKVTVKQEVHDDISRELGLGIWREIEEDELIFPEDEPQRRTEDAVVATKQKESKSPLRWILGPLLLLGVLGLLIFGILKGFNSDTQFAQKMDKNMPVTKNKPPVKPKPKPKPPKERSSVLDKPVSKPDKKPAKKPEESKQPKSFGDNSTSTRGMINDSEKVPKDDSEKASKKEKEKPKPNLTDEEKPKEENKKEEEITKTTEEPEPVKEVKKTKKKNYEGPLSLLNMVANRKVASVINFGNMHTPGNEVTSSGKNQLNQVAEIMNANPNLNITIRGHHKKYTSDIDNSNADISTASRANTVKAYLEVQGISSNRIKAESVGFKEPVNAQDPGNLKNDRISIKTK